jgi:hypothetical protein
MRINKPIFIKIPTKKIYPAFAGVTSNRISMTEIITRDAIEKKRYTDNNEKFNFQEESLNNEMCNL